MQSARNFWAEQSASSFMAQLPSRFASATESLRTSIIRPLTVLVVEDDPSLLSLAAHVFGQKGHNVLTDVDAFGALALLRSHSVDLLFTDVDLAHGTNGVALARDARALRSDLPVAYTSGRIDLIPTAFRSDSLAISLSMLS